MADDSGFSLVLDSSLKSGPLSGSHQPASTGRRPIEEHPGPNRDDVEAMSHAQPESATSYNTLSSTQQVAPDSSGSYSLHLSNQGSGFSSNQSAGFGFEAEGSKLSESFQGLLSNPLSMGAEKAPVRQRPSSGNQSSSTGSSQYSRYSVPSASELQSHANRLHAMDFDRKDDDDLSGPSHAGPVSLSSAVQGILESHAGAPISNTFYPLHGETSIPNQRKRTNRYSFPVAVNNEIQDLKTDQVERNILPEPAETDNKFLLEVKPTDDQDDISGSPAWNRKQVDSTRPVEATIDGKGNSSVGPVYGGDVRFFYDTAVDAESPGDFSIHDDRSYNIVSEGQKLPPTSVEHNRSLRADEGDRYDLSAELRDVPVNVEPSDLSVGSNSRQEGGVQDPNEPIQPPDVRPRLARKNRSHSTSQSQSSHIQDTAYQSSRTSGPSGNRAPHAFGRSVSTTPTFGTYSTSGPDTVGVSFYRSSSQSSMFTPRDKERLRSKPDSVKQTLAEEYAEMGIKCHELSPGEAQSHFEKCFELNAMVSSERPRIEEGQIENYIYAGKSYFNDGNYQRALEYFDAAEQQLSLTGQPPSADLLEMKARAYDSIGQREKAEECRSRIH